MHYVIGDVHGCFDEFNKMINMINDRDNEAEFYLVGDIIDRGPKVLEMLEWAKKNIRKNSKFHMVRGNHEQMIIDWYSDYRKLRKDTKDNNYPITRFGLDEVLNENGLLNDGYVLPVVKFFENLPLYLQVEISNKAFVICHAFVPEWNRLKNILDGAEIDRCEYDDFLWYRGEIGYYNGEITIIHGHTPTIILGSDKIIKGRNVINVDCGCVYKDYGGRLAAICLETEEEFYI